MVWDFFLSLVCLLFGYMFVNVTNAADEFALHVQASVPGTDEHQIIQISPSPGDLAFIMLK